MGLDGEPGPARRADGRAEQDVVQEDEVGGHVLAQHGRVRLDVELALRQCEVAEQLRLEPLVLVQHEHRQQLVRQAGPDHLRAAEVEPLRMPLLAEHHHFVSGPGPLARDRAGVDVRPAPTEQVPVPEEDAHG